VHRTELVTSLYHSMSCDLYNSFAEQKTMHLTRTFVAGDVATLHSHLIRTDGSLSHLQKVVAIKINKVAVQILFAYSSSKR
jgi:hypothetical protein